MKRMIYQLIDEDRNNQRGEAIVHYLIAGLIILNVLALFLESYSEIEAHFKTELYWFEMVSVVIFSIEYLLRVWTADLKYPDSGAIGSRLRYMFSFMGLIDLIAILPFYLPYFFKIDLRAIRMLRLLRLLRILKLGRHSHAFKLIGIVLKKTRADILVTFLIVAFLLVISATLMYDIENEAQPEAFSNIGEALWWSVATLTTVGYGDIYPITGLGKALSGIIALLGIGIVALPTGIISSAYIEAIREQKQERKALKQVCTCPHCNNTFTV